MVMFDISCEAWTVGRKWHVKTDCRDDNDRNRQLATNSREMDADRAQFPRSASHMRVFELPKCRYGYYIYTCPQLKQPHNWSPDLHRYTFSTRRRQLRKRKRSTPERGVGAARNVRHANCFATQHNSCLVVGNPASHPFKEDRGSLSSELRTVVSLTKSESATEREREREGERKGEGQCLGAPLCRRTPPASSIYTIYIVCTCACLHVRACVCRIHTFCFKHFNIDAAAFPCTGRIVGTAWACADCRYPFRTLYFGRSSQMYQAVVDGCHAEAVLPSKERSVRLPRYSKGPRCWRHL